MYRRFIIITYFIYSVTTKFQYNINNKKTDFIRKVDYFQDKESSTDRCGDAYESLLAEGL